MTSLIRLRLVTVLFLTAALFACASPKPELAYRPDHGSEIAVQAMSMIGQPYVWGGSNPSQGFDCSGLVHFVYQQALGLTLPRTARQMSGTGSRVSRSRLKAGDLVFFNTGRRFSHVGIYVGDGRFVHSPRAGKTIRLARLGNRYWKRRYNGARRPDTRTARLASNASG